MKINRMEIAYCFLTYDHLVRKDLWEKYFHGKSNFHVFIHSKISFDPSLYSFPIHLISNPIPTKNKTDISIVRATLHLLKEAYSYSSSISHFVFLTQSCIPIYSFHRHYSLITQLPKSCISKIPKNKIERHLSLSPFLQQKIPKHLFVKQQPNMILTREDLQWFLENDYTQHFCRMECPDEHYFINLFLFLYQKPFFHHQINFCNIHPDRTQAKTYQNVDANLLHLIRSRGHLFMRKVTSFSKINENELWK